jgi:hypothetical protein
MIEQDSRARIQVAGVEGVVFGLESREVTLIEEEPRRVKDAARSENPAHFTEVVLGLARG